MNQERIISAAIAETRHVITADAKLSDAEAFALHVLCDLADRKLDVDRLQAVYSVRVGSDRIYSI